MVSDNLFLQYLTKVDLSVFSVLYLTDRSISLPDQVSSIGPHCRIPLHVTDLPLTTDKVYDLVIVDYKERHIQTQNLQPKFLNEFPYNLIHYSLRYTKTGIVWFSLTNNALYSDRALTDLLVKAKLLQIHKTDFNQYFVSMQKRLYKNPELQENEKDLIKLVTPIGDPILVKTETKKVFVKQPKSIHELKAIAFQKKIRDIIGVL